jgi:hypothetical protein
MCDMRRRGCSRGLARMPSRKYSLLGSRGPLCPSGTWSASSLRMALGPNRPSAPLCKILMSGGRTTPCSRCSMAMRRECAISRRTSAAGSSQMQFERTCCHHLERAEFAALSARPFGLMAITSAQSCRLQRTFWQNSRQSAIAGRMRSMRPASFSVALTRYSAMPQRRC